MYRVYWKTYRQKCFQKKRRSRVKIELNEATLQSLDDYLDNHQNFQSLDELVNFILCAVLSEAERKTVDKNPNTVEELSMVKKRLQDLGYIE